VSAEKKPVSRNLAILIGGGAIASILLGAVITLIMTNPGAAREEAAAEQAEREIAGQPEADISALERRLQERDRQVEVERARADEAERRADVATGTRGAASRTDDESDELPAFDPELLEALERADAEVGARPRLTAGTGRTLNQGGDTGAGGIGASGQSAPAMFESYDTPSVSERLEDARDDSDEPFETITPRSPPSGRVISQGSMIRASLLSRIDTRNPGEIVAQVSSDVYDSTTASTLLIPKGSRLIGTYETSVEPGNPRIGIAFRRLMLPDGRAIELPDMAAVSNDGTSGVDGDYKGNLLRSIGPSIMVTLIGAWADEQTRPDVASVSPSPGGTFQSPSVVQQVVPQINQAVLRRYEGAAPYFVAEPGQSLKVLVSADIQIPVAGGES